MLPTVRRVIAQPERHTLDILWPNRKAGKVGRLTAIVILVLFAAFVQAHQSTDAVPSGSSDSAKKKEPKKKGGFFRSVADAVGDGAKEGASDAAKENKPVVKVSTDNKSTEQVGTEVGNEAVRKSDGNGNRVETTTPDTGTGNEKLSGGRPCEHYGKGDQADAGTCVDHDGWNKSIAETKAKMGFNDRAKGSSGVSGSEAKLSDNGLNADGSCGSVPARIVKIQERRGYQCTDGKMVLVKTDAK